MISFSKFKFDLDQAPFVLKEFASLLDRPQLIAFGAGNAFHGLRTTIDLPFCVVIDDTAGYAGQSVDGLSIQSTRTASSMGPATMLIHADVHSASKKSYRIMSDIQPAFSKCVEVFCVSE